MRYFYNPSTDQVLGPVVLEELHSLRQQARIEDGTPVIEEGAENWRTYEDFAPTPSLPPPSPPLPLSPARAFEKRLQAFRWSFRFYGPALAVVALAIVLFVRVGVSKPDGGNNGASSPTPGVTGQLPDTWRFVAYQGKHAPYRLFLPNFWTELPRPLDENADRTFAGPCGLVLSFYRFNDLDSFWMDLKKTVPVTKIEQGRAGHEHELTIYSTPVNGVRMVRYAAVIPFDYTQVAVTMRAPEDSPVGIIEALVADVGFYTGYSRAAYGNPDRPDVFAVQPRTSSILLTELGKWADIERASGALLSEPSRVTKDAYKARLSFYFRWSVGNKLDEDATSFQRIMGRPAHTQTLQLGHEVQTAWSYDCADGTIQLVTDARLLANDGRLQATVNDY